MEFDFILGCGDSFTEGCQDQIGLGPKGTWPGMLAKRFGVPFANLGTGGSSNTRIALQPVNTPHGRIQDGSPVEWHGLENAKKPLLIFAFTVMDRWTYFNPDNGLIDSHFSIDPKFMSQTDNHGNYWTHQQQQLPINAMGRHIKHHDGQSVDCYTFSTIQAVKLAMQYELLIPGATVLWGFIHERIGHVAFLDTIKTLGDSTVHPPIVHHNNMTWPSEHRCFNRFTDWEPMQRLFHNKREYWLTETDGHPNLDGISLITDIFEKGIREL